MLKKILILSVAFLALMGTPAAAQYGDVLSATISNTNPQPGETVTLSGTCEVADEVTVVLPGVSDLITIPVVDDQFSGPITIPSDLDPGTYTITVTCGTEVEGVQFTIGGRTTVGATPLARTGSDDTGLLLQIGGGLVLAGALFSLVATKRRSATL